MACRRQLTIAYDFQSRSSTHVSGVVFSCASFTLTTITSGAFASVLKSGGTASRGLRTSAWTRGSSPRSQGQGSRGGELDGEPAGTGQQRGGEAGGRRP